MFKLLKIVVPAILVADVCAVRIQLVHPPAGAPTTTAAVVAAAQPQPIAPAAGAPSALMHLATPGTPGAFMAAALVPVQENNRQLSSRTTKYGTKIVNLIFIQCIKIATFSS